VKYTPFEFQKGLMVPLSDSIITPLHHDPLRRLQPCSLQLPGWGRWRH